jgi:hypothetical protein
MQNNNINELNGLKNRYWFQQPANIFLIAVVAATGVLYLINPIIEMLTAG